MWALFQKFGAWLLEVLLYIPKKIYETFCDSIIALIDGIFALCPSCDIANINGALGSIPSGVWWFLSWFNFGQGIVIISSAYLVRFLIRRLPVIG